jgi:protein-disulfide isomerase
MGVTPGTNVVGMPLSRRRELLPQGETIMAHWRTLLDSAASVSMIGASAALLWVTLRPSAVIPAKASGAAGVENVESTKWRLPASGTLGTRPPQVKVVLIEFSDFECPFCQRYSRDTFPQVKRAFIDSGKIAYIFRNNPLVAIHPRARTLAVAAICAGDQGRFWEVHQLLFGDPRRSQVSVPDLARGLGIDATRYAECVKAAPSRLETELAANKELGIGSTPTFLLGEFTSDDTILVRRRINGAQPFETFKKSIEEALMKPAE